MDMIYILIGLVFAYQLGRIIDSLSVISRTLVEIRDKQ